MQTRVNMTEHEFTVALMVFLVAYSVFEAPSNLALKVLSPHRCVQRTKTPSGPQTWLSPSLRSS